MKPSFQCQVSLKRKLSKVSCDIKKAKIIEVEQKRKGCNWTTPKQGHLTIMGLKFKHCPCNYKFNKLHHYIYLLECWKKNHLPGPGTPLEQDNKDMETIRLLETLDKEHQKSLKDKEERDGKG